MVEILKRNVSICRSMYVIFLLLLLLIQIQVFFFSFIPNATFYYRIHCDNLQWNNPLISLTLNLLTELDNI